MVEREIVMTQMGLSVVHVLKATLVELEILAVVMLFLFFPSLFMSLCGGKKSTQ